MSIIVHGVRKPNTCNCACAFETLYVAYHNVLRRGCNAVIDEDGQPKRIPEDGKPDWCPIEEVED